MWEHLAPPEPEPPHATVLLLGAAVAAKCAFLGDFNGSAALAYHHFEEVRDGAVHLRLDTFMFNRCRPSLAAQLDFKGLKIVIVSFDWHCVAQWPQTAVELASLAGPKTAFLVTSHNYAEVAANPRLALSKDVDFAHQWLRTLALRLSAPALMYPLESTTETEWRVLIEKLARATTDAELTPAQFVGDSVRVYNAELGGAADTQAKILTVNPEFPFENALRNEIELEPLVTPPEPDYTPLVSLPSLLRQVVTEFADRQQTPVSTDVRRVVTDNEEHRMISDFFSSIAARTLP